MNPHHNRPARSPHRPAASHSGRPESHPPSGAHPAHPAAAPVARPRAPVRGAFSRLLPPLQRAVSEEGYEVPTPIQEQSIPHVLEGRDLLGCAQTGTGKTAAFTLPMIQRLELAPRPTAPRRPRALILAPTRELAAQIGESLRRYGRHARLRHAVVFGGVGQHPQVQALRRGVDVLVATPGRLLDLMNQQCVLLDDVEIFVLDEADRMLDMGFIHDVKRIIARLPARRQTLFFSATLEPPVVALSRSLVHDPVHITVTPEQPAVDRIAQSVMFVQRADKMALLIDLLRDERINRVLVFAQMKHAANRISEKLKEAGIQADAIHGNKSQTARTRALEDFKRGRVRALVATDIAARGIDVDAITHVVNYDLPTEPETYVHRIGRTARAGAEGDAISFCSSEERDALREIERMIRIEIPVQTEHAFHSEAARRATGAAARPPPRGARRGSFRGPPQPAARPAAHKPRHPFGKPVRPRGPAGPKSKRSP